MANLLSGISNNAANANPAAQQMQIMAMANNISPDTMLGYKLGQLVSNYLYRGQQKSGTKDAADVVNKLVNGDTSGTAQVAATPATINQAAQPITQAAQDASTAAQTAATPAVLTGIPTASQTAAQMANPTFGTSANLLDDINSNGSLKTAQNAANTSSVSPNILDNLGTTISGLGSADKLANGQGSILDLANIAKIAGFFDPAASASKAGAAAQTPAKKDSTDNSQSSQQQNQTDNATQQPAQQQSQPNTAIQQLIQQAVNPTYQNATPLQAQQGLSPAQRVAAQKMHDDIIQLKAVYQKAQDAGDIAGMQKAHEQANMIRDTASRLGLSTAAFGTDDSLNQAVSQKETEDYNEQVRRIVNPDPSSQMVRNQVYNALRAKGYGFDVANQIADEQAQTYQAKRVNDLTTQIQNQGISQTGALNNNGVASLIQMLGESPQTYQALASMYANPKNDYDFNNAIKQAVNNQALQKDLAGFNSNLHMKESDHNLGNTIKLNANTLQNQMQLKQFEAGLNVQQKQALAQIELQTQGMAMQQKYQVMYNAAKQFGADETTAKNYALGTSVTGTKAMSPQMIAGLDAAKALIADKHDFVKNNMDPKKEYPYEDQYQQAIKLYGSLLNGATGNGGNSGSSPSSNVDVNDYNSVMSNATDWLSKITQNGGYSKQQIINGFEKMYGKDMAQQIVNDIDWSQWGY